jgi:hypothetical protein
VRDRGNGEADLALTRIALFKKSFLHPDLVLQTEYGD